MLAALFAHWLFHPLYGKGYQFWSGLGGQIAVGGGVVTLLLGFWHKHNCAVEGCWRMHWHVHPDHDVPVCRKHHPSYPLTKENTCKSPPRG